jgi:large subunit ribosomal protein L6
MRPEKIEEVLEIPEGIDVDIDGNMIKVKGPKGELNRAMAYPKVDITREEKRVKFYSKKPTKKEKRMLFTFKSHLNNMIRGVVNGYEYRLKLCSGHFPVTLKPEGKKIIISNFLGEKIARSAKVIDGVKVKIEGDNIMVTGIDIEKVGQTCSNLEKATKIRNRDRRVFQSGIFLTKKIKPIGGK